MRPPAPAAAAVALRVWPLVDRGGGDEREDYSDYGAITRRRSFDLDDYERSYSSTSMRRIIIIVQGQPSGLVGLHLVGFDLRVPPRCPHAVPTLPDLQLPKQNQTDIVKSKSTSPRLDS